MSQAEKQFLKVGPITRNWDAILNYLNDGSRLTFVQTEYHGLSEIELVTKENIAVIGNKKFEKVEETPYEIKKKLFEINTITVKDMLFLKTYKQLEEFKTFVDDVTANCPTAIDDMKESDFHLYKQCQEDLFRVKNVQKNFPGIPMYFTAPK